MKESGLKVLVIDKSFFPRDKVCGDAIPNTVIKALKLLNENYVNALREFPAKTQIKSCKVVAPSGKSILLNFKLEGYASTRFNFDNFLLQIAEKNSGASIIKGEAVNSVTITSDGVELSTTGGKNLLQN